jgi:YggT family protein
VLVQVLRVVLTYVLTIYLVILIGRMIFGWIQVFARDWRPTGILLVLAEAIFTVTDPPLKFLRRFIPPLRLGMVAMDLSFMVLFIVVLILLEVAVPHL